MVSSFGMMALMVEDSLMMALMVEDNLMMADQFFLYVCFVNQRACESKEQKMRSVVLCVRWHRLN